MRVMTRSVPAALATGTPRVIHPPWPGYPLSGCTSAEPDSVSPGVVQRKRQTRAKQVGSVEGFPRLGGPHARPSVVRADFGHRVAVVRRSRRVEIGPRRGTCVFGASGGRGLELPGMWPGVSAPRPCCRANVEALGHLPISNPALRDDAANGLRGARRAGGAAAVG